MIDIPLKLDLSFYIIPDKLRNSHRIYFLTVKELATCSTDNTQK